MTEIKYHFNQCPNCEAPEFWVLSSELRYAEGVIECECCATLLKPAIKTIVYCEVGYFGSEKLWRDTSYAFQHRNEVKYVSYGTYAAPHNYGDWVYLGNNRNEVAKDLNIDIDLLPEYDNEFCVLE